MKRAVLLSVAAATALSLAACQKKEAAPEAAAPETAATPSAAAPAPAADATQTAAATPDEAAGPIDPAPPPPASADAAKGAGATEATETVINGVALTDLYQIQAGKIAEAKAQSPAVKDFAKMMVADHATMTNQMKHVFAALGAKVPTELGPRGTRMIDALNAASPADFDKTYLNQQEAAQAAELATLRVYADSGESTDIKPAAEKRIPAVKAHLDKVHELQAAPPA
jgi:putative membrane protein